MSDDQKKADEAGDNEVQLAPRSTHGRLYRSYATVNVYAFLLGSLLFILNSMWIYRLGVLTTIEKRFKLSSAQSGFTVSGFEIGHVGTMFAISYFGANLHKPRLVAIGGALCTISALLFTLPHTVYGSGRDDLITENVTLRNVTPLRHTCQATAAGNETNQICDSGVEYSSYNGAYVTLVISSVILGIALVPMLSLGITFIDDNIESEKFPAYYGVVMSCLMAGSISGFGVAAIFTSVDIDLKPDVNVTPDDPRWLGAYWLGMLVMAGVSVLPFLAMAIFPEHLPNLSHSVRMAQAKAKQQKKTAKGLLTSMRSLILNGAYVSVVIGSCCDAYISSGYLAFMPKFIEIQFDYSAYTANVISALSFGVTGCIGCMIGGVACARLANERRMCIYVIVCVIVSAIAMGTLAFVGCDDRVLAGNSRSTSSQFSLQTTCNQQCAGGCNTHEMIPVCDAHGTMYFSPCHAGCSDVTVNTHNYTSCTCADWASGNQCDYSCGTIVPYCCIVIIVILLSTMSVPASGAIILRIVSKDTRDLALGMLTGSLSLLAYLPGPAIYGAAIDFVCQVWQNDCGTRGVCWWYDVTLYRYVIHGLTAAFKVISIPAFAYLLYAIPSRKVDPSQEETVLDIVEASSSLVTNKD